MSGNENGFAESLSDAEMAYFNTKGEDTSGFGSEQPAEAPQQPAGGDFQSSEPNGQAQQEPPQQAAEGDDDDGIYIDENGKARSVATGKFVPHAALHKERTRRQAVEAENLTMREKMARAEERLAVLNEVLMATPADGGDPQQQAQTKTVEEELGPAPDPEKDIFAYVQWQQKKIELQDKRFNEMLEAQMAAQQAQQNQQQSQQFQQAYQNDAINFIQKQPDFPEAYKFIANSFATELKSMGYNDQQIQQRLMQEEAVLVSEAFQRNMSPAQVIYDRARARGYNPTQAAQQHQQNTQQKLETIQKGQRATASLSAAGGSSGEGLTVEAIANMSEEEFAALHSKLGKSKIRQLLGG